MVYNQATMGEDARGTIASMKARREKREPVVCFLRFRFLDSEGFWVTLVAGSMLDHQIISPDMLLLEQGLLVDISSMVETLSFLVVGLYASLERAARMVTFDVFRKKPRAAA